MQYILIIRNHFKAEYRYMKINKFHDMKLVDLFLNINKPKKKEKKEIKLNSEKISTQSYTFSEHLIVV